MFFSSQDDERELAKSLHSDEPDSLLHAVAYGLCFPDRSARVRQRSMHSKNSTVPESITGWIEDVAVRLLEGRQTAPSTCTPIGKTHLVRLLAATLGPTAVVVNGADFSEANQASQACSASVELEATLEAHGSAQLLFDGFDRALIRTHGTAAASLAQ